jgi:hypothetical protein
MGTEPKWTGCLRHGGLNVLKRFETFHVKQRNVSGMLQITMTNQTKNTQENAEPVVSKPRPTGFEPPEQAVQARLRRINLRTGGWEDAPMIIEGGKSVMIDAQDANDQVIIAENIATIHRFTWYAANNSIVGYSKTFKVESGEESQAGASNTPRMWPPHPAYSTNGTQFTSVLTPNDTVSLMRGLSILIHEASAPLIAQVSMFAEQTLARERAFHEARLQAERQRHEEAMARDRAFLMAMRDFQEKPKEQRIASLERQLEQLQETEEEPASQQPSPWDVAGKLIEHGPALISEISKQVKGTGHEPTD